MILAYDAKNYADQVAIAKVLAHEKRATEWLDTNASPKIEAAAKRGATSVSVDSANVRIPMKPFIEKILHESGYTFRWNNRGKMITIKWR